LLIWKLSHKLKIQNIKTIQGIKKTQGDSQFLKFRIKGLPTLGVGSMQAFFLLVVGASQCWYIPKLNAFISMDHID